MTFIEVKPSSFLLLVAMASMASTLAMASNLVAMASHLVAVPILPWERKERVITKIVGSWFFAIQSSGLVDPKPQK